jgi:hypothetical protein
MSETKEIRIYEAPEELYERLELLSSQMANVSISKLSLMLLDEALKVRGVGMGGPVNGKKK